jgi:hypothetical protein
MQSLRLLAAVSIALFTIACGGNEPAGETGGSAAPAAADPSASPAAVATITADDLAAYERGIRRETEAVRAAQKAAASATDAQARGQAMQAQWDTATIPQGAEASGLTESRYRAVRLVVHDILQTLDFQGKIDGPLSIDLSRADEATKARLSRDAFADLPPDSAATIRDAVPRLAPAWSEYVTLTAVAG